MNFAWYLLLDRSQGVNWISIVRGKDNYLQETKRIQSVKSAFKGTNIVTTKTLKTLAEKFSLTKGKWMLFGETGNIIDRLWRAIADGIIRGTIPAVSAIVSATNDNHVICIYNNNFLNVANTFALRDGIRNVGIQNSLTYKPEIYKHLGIANQNKWGIDPILHRGRLNVLKSVIWYVKSASLCNKNLKKNLAY